MIVTPTTVELHLPAPIAPRSKGVHASSVIRSIAMDMGILKRELAEEVGLVDVREITDPTQILRMSIGLAFEEWYLPHILSKYGVAKHPGEMKVDGIYMTPDGESVDVIITPKGHTALRIHEIKATYKSTRTVGDVKGEWMWLTQMMAYCKGAKTTHARLHVLFLCGDYSYPITPQIKVWDIDFTQREIDERWELLTEYRDYKEKP